MLSAARDSAYVLETSGIRPTWAPVNTGSVLEVGCPGAFSASSAWGQTGDPAPTILTFGRPDADNILEVQLNSLDGTGNTRRASPSGEYQSQVPGLNKIAQKHSPQSSKELITWDLGKRTSQRWLNLTAGFLSTVKSPLGG